MGNGSFSRSSDQNNTSHHASTTEPKQRLALDFQYTDRQNSIKIENRIRFLPTDTIRAVAKEFLTLDEEYTISPDKVILVSVRLAEQYSTVPVPNAHMTLHELGIENGSLLCFEPSSIRARPKLLHLTIFSPDGEEKKDYEWDEKLTTLHMLLEHVIKVFALNSITRTCILLCTFLNENLNRSNNSGKKLSELGLKNYSEIFVTIIKSTFSSKYDQDIYVHVTSTFHGEILLHASRMDTVAELENHIKRRFKQSPLITIKLSNAKYQSLDVSNRTRKLGELGIHSGETINAIAQEDLPEKQIPAKNSHAVFVKCAFSTNESTTIQASLTDTVAEVMAKIAALRKNQSIAQFRLYSGSIDIDDKQSGRRLADFGITPGSTIYASMKDMNPVDHSIKSSKVDTSLKSSRNHQIDLKPLGLVNLGNTCFMNSALQCLTHVAPLTHFFLNGFARAHTVDDNHNGWNPFDTCGEVTGAYAELLWNMWQSDRKDGDYVGPFKPTRIKETIGYFAPRFATSDQQDAQEFMTFLLNAIHDELAEKNKPDRNTIIKQLFFGTVLSKITCLECNHVKTTTNRIGFLPLSLTRQERMFTVNFLTKDGKQDCSLVTVSANGRVGNLVQAFLEPRYLSHLFNHIVVIPTNSEGQLKFETPLSRLFEHEITLIEQEDYINHIRPDRLDKEPDYLSLQECLQEFVSLEQLDDLWFCQQGTCGRNTHASKQLQFYSLPLVLVIQLKRFSYEVGWRRKLDIFVDCPMNGLNLSHLTSSSQQAMYDLIAVSNHIGSIYGGHYTAYARQEPNTDKWYKFDDCDVSTVSSQREIISRDAYLLFYIKRHSSLITT